MYNYKLTIQYDGGRYKGWQRLGDSDNTVQGKIEKALSVLVGHQVEIIGASRTDAGVHALAQIANFKISEPIAESKMMNFLNHYLPPDICITRVELVDDRFHARYHAKDKTYLYKIWNEEYSHPFMRKYSMHVKKKLSLEEMKKGCQYFIGEHDFTVYSNAKSNKKDMVRTIYSMDVEVSDGFIQFRVCGNGFLYNMVRKMIGTLIEIGLGEKKAEEIPAILQSKERRQTGGMVDACGLYLERINFQ
ncbi:tRNA pseudouridine(38-40) synthase TruA [Marinicrinis lubricantis]|uniref:tRNA pseudouridine synthase A n=1 Tax=Marinicrinis lubricantis TaxID=2086470 RepID=A0ABW1IKU3_9BACL